MIEYMTIKMSPFLDPEGSLSATTVVLLLVLGAVTHHRRAVAQPCINGDSLSQWRMPKFDPL